MNKANNFRIGILGIAIFISSEVGYSQPKPVVKKAQTTQRKLVETTEYRISPYSEKDKFFLYSLPDITSKTLGYFLSGDYINPIKKQGNYFYLEVLDTNGDKKRGWILSEDISVTTMQSYEDIRPSAPVTTKPLIPPNHQLLKSFAQSFI